MCTFYAKGTCRNGASCRFRHIGGSAAPQPVPSTRRSVCKHYAIGRCTKGASCRYMHSGGSAPHPPPPGSATKICSACQQPKVKGLGGFSGNQWNKGPGVRRCTPCIGGYGGQPAPRPGPGSSPPRRPAPQPPRYTKGQGVQYNTLGTNGWIDVTIVNVHIDHRGGAYYVARDTYGNEQGQIVESRLRARAGAPAVGPGPRPPRAPPGSATKICSVCQNAVPKSSVRGDGGFSNNQWNKAQGRRCPPCISGQPGPPLPPPPPPPPRPGPRPLVARSLAEKNAEFSRLFSGDWQVVPDSGGETFRIKIEQVAGYQTCKLESELHPSLVGLKAIHITACVVEGDVREDSAKWEVKWEMPLPRRALPRAHVRLIPWFAEVFQATPGSFRLRFGRRWQPDDPPGHARCTRMGDAPPSLRAMST